MKINKAMFLFNSQRILKHGFSVFFLLFCYSVAFAQSAGDLVVMINSSATVIKAGDSLHYFDQSEGSPTEWNWTFPGGIPSSSTEQNPKVKYLSEGSYPVILTINDAEGNEAAQTFTGYVSVLSMNTYWWNDAVFYEVFVRSFKDSDGDGKGDLQGLINKLDYLNDGDPSTSTDLGITGIWLMPVQQSPSYHGYDIIDYRTVEQDYGTNEDFKTFIAEAHKRGIKVIVDYVMNHTSSQHPWFIESTNSVANKRDWYVWQNPAPAVTGPWGQTVWYSKNGSNYYGIFWSEMPDLNYNKAEVKDEMFDVARFWLEDMDVDGFRLDAVKYIFENSTTLEDAPETIQFWKDFRTYYKSVDGDAFAVGEAWTSTDKVAPYVNNNGLDYCFEFDLASTVISSIGSANAASLNAQVEEAMSAYPFLQFGNFLTNHDMNRVMDQFARNTAKARIASDLLLTLPGVPYIYYGEEIGMTGSKPDENIRTPLQWNNTAQAGFTTGTPWRTVNADYTTKNIEVQQPDANSLWNNYRKLIAIRNTQIALRRGNYKKVSASSSAVFSFLRQYDDENIIVISNLSAGTITNVQISLTQGGITSGTYTLVELRGGGQLTLVVDNMGGFSNLTIHTIAGRSTLIYKLLDPSEVATDVTFQVDMNEMISEGDFNPSTESIDVVADFNNYGTGSPTYLTDDNGDGIYAITISGLDIGHKSLYKYRINGVNDGREEFPSSTYFREHIVMEAEDTVTDQYQMQTVTSLEYSTLHSVSVYPVPSSKELYLSYSPDFTGTISYTINDMMGRERVSSSFTSTSSGQYSLSDETLPAGVYMLTIVHNGASKTFRIIIQK